MGGCGMVFKMSSHNGGWTFAPLYSFTGNPDGAYPEGRLSFGHDGRLYGTTGRGGLQNQTLCDGCGTVFAMRPPATFCRSVVCTWSEQVLYRFVGNDDGARPTGDIAFDSAGHLFGTAYYGGLGGGTVYELSSSAGGWTFNLVHGFNGNDGENPYGGVSFDSSGHLYGTTQFGGTMDKGVVFQFLTPQSGGTENVLYSFNGIDGDQPAGGLVLDAVGNIYGTTNRGGPTGIGGKVFGLAPSGGGYTFSLLQSFTGDSGPWGDLLMDGAGNLYGTTVREGAHNSGSVFKLTNSNGTWIFTTLHDFDGSDGAYPHGAMVFDASGNLYGIGMGGGPHNQGVVWEITP
jgi:uncharacterized repeat protein (TIGR03803 family)